MYFIVSIFSLPITNFVPRSIRRKSATGRTGRTGHKAGRVLRRFCAQRKHIRFPFPCTKTERAFLPAGLKQADRSTHLQADSPFLRQEPGKTASAERRRQACCPDPEPAACIVPIYPQGFSEDTLHSLPGNALSSLPCPYGKTAVCPPALQTATDDIPTNARLRPNQCLLPRLLTPVCNAIRHLLEMRSYTADRQRLTEPER